MKHEHTTNHTTPATPTKKTFYFGGIDYNNTGRKDYPVYVTIEYREKDGKKVFTASGRIGARCGGQCLDTIAKYINNPTFNEIFRLWKLYHLNDMHPECEHQAAAGWRETAKESVPLYTFTMTTDAIREQNSIKNAVLQAAINGESLRLSKNKRLVLALDYSITSHTETLPQPSAPYYKLKSTEIKSLGWLSESEHPRGILSRPCPVCGYKYGTSWVYFPIPEEDEQKIYNLLRMEQ